MHHIQSQILRKLLYVTDASYAELRPERVESNHYAYHLEQLQKEGLVQKIDKRYGLSPSGQAYVDRLSQGKMTDRLQPHIVTAVDITTADGRTLLFKRNFQPYIHLIGFPVGKLHYAEPVQQGAERELMEKAGLSGVPLTHRGMVYIHARSQGVTIGRVLYHVFHGEVASELATVTPADRGECFWADHRTLPANACMPGFLHVKTLLDTHSGLFFDEIVTDF